MTDGCRFAFIVSRFPQITETFILREFLGLEARGIDFELFAIIRQDAEHLQPDAAELDARANYISWGSPEVAAAQWHWIRHAPARYLRAWWTALRASWKSPAALLRLPVTFVVAATMARRMQSLGVDRVHAHWITYPTLCALVIKDLAGIPYSVTGHAGDIYGETGGLGVRVDEADLVLTCTEYGRQVLLDRVGPGAAPKIHVVHHGVDLARFALLSPAGDPTDRPVRLLCVAGMHDYKGHRYLLDACRVLADRGIRNELVLVGDGPLRGELEAQAGQLGISDQVRFLGRQPLAEVTAQLEWCDVFVAPSIEGGAGRMDGIPNVLVEAMAVGRPSVASDLPGIRELVIDGETGLLATPKDPVSIADAVERIAADAALRERLTAAGRAKVEAEHDASVELDEVHRRLSGLCG